MKLPTVNTLRIARISNSSGIYNVESITQTYTHNVGQEYYNLRPVNKATYSVNIKRMTCDCEHGKYSNPSDPKFQPCKHICFVQKIQLESKVKNRLHATLNTKVGDIVKIRKITPAKNGMLAVSYFINGGIGCCFINPKSLEKDGHFKVEKIVNSDFTSHYLIKDNDTDFCTIEFTLQGWRKFEVREGKKYVSNWYVDFYEAVHSFPDKPGFYQVLPATKPEQISPEIHLEDQDAINRFRNFYSIFQAIE